MAKLNLYFRKMLAARRGGRKAFKYKGSIYRLKGNVYQRGA